MGQDKDKESQPVEKEEEAGNVVNYTATLLPASIQVALSRGRTDFGLAFCRGGVVVDQIRKWFQAAYPLGPFQVEGWRQPGLQQRRSNHRLGS